MNCIYSGRNRQQSFSRRVRDIPRTGLGRRVAWSLLVLLVSCQTGCQVLQTQGSGLTDTALITGNTAGQIGDEVADPGMRPPSEMDKVSLPLYRIEPPDILIINTIRSTPKAPYELQPLDLLQVVADGLPPDRPVSGTYQVEPTGTLNLGPAYGKVNVQGLTLDEATDAVVRSLRATVQRPMVTIQLFQTAGQQLIQGEHLVAQDGRIYLGIYGSVRVAGLTIDESRQAIEAHLSHYMDRVQISVDVFAFNSKYYYVITQSAVFGDQVARVPVTGNETVLDAVSQLGGLSRLSSRRMWISRPSPTGTNCDAILPIDWNAVTSGARTDTNYQLLPGDRLFIAEDRMVALDGLVSKVLNPFERMFGFTLLGTQTIQTTQRFPEGRFGL
ncbi:MAG: polysaccharide biosynthesis/export family protein [Planctomycetales bacterium]|nr:polysaccharide biosynthesis/export family protein [Planctomycetales bacterium]